MTIRPNLHRERGMTLVMALILLVVLTLLALTSFNLANGNLQAVGNMQQREQAVAAANQVLEETISTTKFFETPSTAVPNPCGAPNQRCVDMDGDGKEDVHVVLATPTCTKANVIKTLDLDQNDPEQANCSDGEGQTRGILGSTDGSSNCANSTWDLNATATDVATGATVKVTQGVAVVVPKDTVDTNCPVGATP